MILDPIFDHFSDPFWRFDDKNRYLISVHQEITLKKRGPKTGLFLGPVFFNSGMDSKTDITFFKKRKKSENTKNIGFFLKKNVIFFVFLKND